MNDASSLSPRSLARAAVAASLATFALGVASAHAQGVDPRLFEPAMSADAVLGVDASGVAPHLGVWGSLFTSWASDELVTRTGPDTTAPGPLRNRLVTTVAAGLGLFDVLELAVGAPVHVVEVPSATGGRSGEVGLGDLRVGLRGRVFGPAAGVSGPGLLLAAELTVPTGGATPFTGDEGVVVTPRLTLDWRSTGGVIVALNASYRVRGAVDIDDLAVGDELRLGLGAEVPLGVYGLSVLGEALAGIGLAETASDPSGVDGRKVPVELLAGLRWRAGTFALSAAAGAGVTEGYGAPDYRVVVGLVFGGAPADAFVERRLDPALLDGAVADASGGLAPVPPLDAAGFDAAAAADPDPDGDGILGEADACPMAPEDFDGFEDEDGCPDPDNDGDGIPDAVDACPNEAEVFNGFEDEDGCPDDAPDGPADGISEADGQLVIDDSIRFTPGSAELTRASERVLDKVAAFLRSRPGIARVRIEGHTDGIGDREFNVDLSERRAWSVRRYLIAQDIAGERLLPKGYGPTRPVASNGTDAGRAKNRRVEFHIMRPGELLDDEESVQ